MIRTDHVGEVFELMLDRPERRNALDLGTLLALEGAIRGAASSGAKAILIHGAGGNFSAGADLLRVGEMLDGDWDEFDQMLASCSRILAALRALPAAVVCAFEGHAVGAGAALLMSGDLVVAAETARLAMGSFALGMTPDAGLSYFLSRAIGARETVRLALTGADLDARALRDAGVVAELVAEGTALVRARELAQRVARTAPPLAIVGLRELVDRSTTQSFEAQYELEAAWVRRLRGSSDFSEGVRAFLERRAPSFAGR
jgi:2-(1,2-epoxy-1,2-dihydrophenyl)acetyl-CoA isomerase